MNTFQLSIEKIQNITKVHKLTILFFGILLVTIYTSAYLYYIEIEKDFKIDLNRRLATISENEIRELASFRNERIGDAVGYYKNEVFYELVHKLVQNP
ncbi:MAG: hypothetical protein HUU45_08220, partial [Leptospiraceae bacterium]|nr:hypothetical protein [Leptospiraceae bacterium]